MSYVFLQICCIFQSKTCCGKNKNFLSGTGLLKTNKQSSMHGCIGLDSEQTQTDRVDRNCQNKTGQEQEGHTDRQVVRT